MEAGLTRRPAVRARPAARPRVRPSRRAPRHRGGDSGMTCIWPRAGA